MRRLKTYVALKLTVWDSHLSICRFSAVIQCSHLFWSFWLIYPQHELKNKKFQLTSISWIVLFLSFRDCSMMKPSSFCFSDRMKSKVEPYRGSWIIWLLPSTAALREGYGMTGDFSHYIVKNIFASKW